MADLHVLKRDLRVFLSMFIIIPLSLLTVTLIIGWFVYFIVKCWRIYKEYKTCKRTPVLHPLYSDVQYLSKQRKLYNLKTHFIKYILMIVCCSFEVASFLCIGSYSIIESNLQPLNNTTDLVIGYLHCTNAYGWIALYNDYPLVITNFLLVFLLSALHLTLLAILSRYLATRYLNHPFKRTLIKYLIWCSIQWILIGFCATKYTWMFMVLINSIISLTNWILLLRATSFLSRVLRSHLMEIKLYSNNRVFYNTQLSAYNFYRIFRIVLLISTLSVNLFEVLFFVWRAIKTFLHYSCQIQINQTVIIPSFYFDSRLWFDEVISLLEELFFILYIPALFLPLCGITFAPLIIKCVKRCREKEDQYRYNYDKLEPLLRRHN